MPCNFDFHMHSRVSFDSSSDPAEMVRAARQRGLTEICFTDHWDDIVGEDYHPEHFDLMEYREAYEGLNADIPVRRGIEVGLLSGNQAEAAAVVACYPFDFVLGSAHCAGREDVYFLPYWEGKTQLEAERRYLESTLEYVCRHDCFDVLSHLTYISKSPCNPAHRPVPLEAHKEIIAEILRTLAQKGKGLEINTSGVNRCGSFLPDVDCVRLFRDLGGKIVTVGSDAHTPDRVGEYTGQAVDIAASVFGYVCTFAGREPVFHRL